MSYSLYTLSEDAMTKFPGKRLELTIPFVLLGIFRYLYLVHQASEGGNPTKLLLTDRVLIAVVLLWAASRGRDHLPLDRPWDDQKSPS